MPLYKSELEHIVMWNCYAGMGRSSSSGGGGLRFVQWNESSREDGLNAGVQRSTSTPTKTMSKNRKMSVDLLAVAAEGLKLEPVEQVQISLRGTQGL